MSRISKFASKNPQTLERELKDYSDRRLRTLYEKRVRQVEKRTSRIEAKWGEKAVTTAAKDLPKSGEGLTREKMLKGISEANRYLLNKTSTLTGYRETLREEQQAFREKDMNFTKKELVDVNNFLDQLRADNLGSLLPSDQIISVAANASRRGFTYEQLKANVEYFGSHPDLKRYVLKANRKGSSNDYRRNRRSKRR